LHSGNSVSSNLQFAKTITFISKPLFKDESFLRQKYEVERLHPTEIAKLAFSSRQTIKKYLTHYKIVLRSEDTRTRKVPPFGLKILRYREQLHKDEQKTILKITSLRSQGLSYQQIAKTLNAVGFRTRMNRGGWHANTVMDIANRAASFLR